jgi:fatty-acyl-CoA synthase
VAVRLNAGHRRETFAVAVEPNAFEDRGEVRRIQRAIAHEVFLEVDFRRATWWCWPREIPKTPSGKLAARTRSRWSADRG